MYAVAVTALSLAMLSGFALTAGGLWLMVKRRAARQGTLMLIMAAVLFANVLIWTL